ncbi:AMP-binding protein [Lacinutrix iliipiscaria]|uniref:AMP-binding protein n=1 Tax=Lacinutrix iliipiscaria TaxID=1230532 RepID=A0ABW5WN99_9FLAO
MIPTFNKIHNRFKLNSSSYNFEELKEVAYSHVKEGLPFEKSIGNFLTDWLDDKDYILVPTSGSTGTPKTIKLQKQAMVHSALATGDFFNLKPGDKALHCLSSDFIAGKMMLVRALILGLELDVTEPASIPVFDYKKAYNFCAMVPMQLQKTITHCSNIKTIILGGAPVSSALKADLQSINSNVFETYGMTETITHIAVKKLNHLNVTDSEFFFQTLPNIKITQDSRNCLVIDAKNLSDNKIITNDVVKLHSETAFEWLGRYDHVINSGGVKVFPEQLEAKLSKEIPFRFFISKETDDTLGERIILVIEAPSNELNSSVFEGLNKFEIPKKIYSVEKFTEASNGKVLRQKTLKKIK